MKKNVASRMLTGQRRTASVSGSSSVGVAMHCNRQARRYLARTLLLRLQSSPTGALLLSLGALLLVVETHAALPIKLPPLPTPRWFYNGTYASPLCETTFRCDTSSRNGTVPSCSCHPNCSLYDACCEDVRPSDWRQRALPPYAYECAVYPRLGTDVNGNFLISTAAFVFLITGCPSNYTGSCLARLCGSPTSGTTEGTLRFTWVTDQLTGVTYKNRFCAACHGVNEDKMVFWDQLNACMEDPGLSIFGLTGCKHHVLTQETVSSKLPHCYGPYYSRCPHESSQEQQEACADSPARFIYDRTNFVTYRNYNCSLCDSLSESAISGCTPNTVSFFHPPTIDFTLVSGARGCHRDNAECEVDEERRFVKELCDRCRTAVRRTIR